MTDESQSIRNEKLELFKKLIGRHVSVRFDGGDSIYGVVESINEVSGKVTMRFACGAGEHEIVTFHMFRAYSSNFTVSY